jgi:uncharacterized protein (DUF427 family)
MKIPGPDHPISIEPNPKRVRVMFNSRVVAETTRALTLREARLPPVQYIPRADADMAFFTRTAHGTHCPYKGDAAYYSLEVDCRISENAVWTYEAPYPAVAQIKDHLAYPNRVDASKKCRLLSRTNDSVRSKAVANAPGTTFVSGACWVTRCRANPTYAFGAAPRFTCSLAKPASLA